MTDTVAARQPGRGESADRVTLEIADGLAHLRLARPAGRNGIDMLMVRALADRFAVVAEDPGVRVLLIGADGPAFSVGGDLATGYRLHDRDAVHLFCVETLAPQTVTPEAVCLLDS